MSDKEFWIMGTHPCLARIPGRHLNKPHAGATEDLFSGSLV